MKRFTGVMPALITPLLADKTLNVPDEMLLMGLNAGADGGIGSTYNLFLPQIRAIYDNYVKGNAAKAQNIQMQVNKGIHTLLNYELIPAIKAVLQSRGYEVGNAVFPMKRYNKEQQQKILAELCEAGF